MSAREEIMTSVAREQRGLGIKVGDRFLRGVEIVTVTAIGEGLIGWTTAAGDELTGSRRAFTGRRLARIPAPPPDQGDLLEGVWVIASAKTLSHAERLRLLSELYPATSGGEADGLSDTDRATVTAWLTSLRRGEEPQRTPKVRTT